MQRSGGTGNPQRQDRNKTKINYHLARVQQVLEPFRFAHGWQEGMVWDPYRGTYRWPVAGETGVS